MELREALDYIVSIQAGLAITAPVEMKIAHAYKYFPSQSSAAPDRPFFMNAWALPDATFRPNGWAQLSYTLNMQLCVEDADLDRAADIATAFHEELLKAFAFNQTLNGGGVIRRIRGNDPTLVMLTFAGQDFVGLDLFLDFTLNPIRDVGP